MGALRDQTAFNIREWGGRRTAGELLGEPDAYRDSSNRLLGSSQVEVPKRCQYWIGITTSQRYRSGTSLS